MITMIAKDLGFILGHYINNNKNYFESQLCFTLSVCFLTTGDCIRIVVVTGAAMVHDPFLVPLENTVSIPEKYHL